MQPTITPAGDGVFQIHHPAGAAPAPAAPDPRPARALLPFAPTPAAAPQTSATGSAHRRREADDGIRSTSRPCQHVLPPAEGSGPEPRHT
ncbi:MAG: hypothetical protein MZV70_56765 [Desulfobacterales bacterium]|nr:hypothetical protein [Desulfobacterales bacterium]